MILDGIVLAGGGSRRMGRDKATLVHRDGRLVDRAVRCLEQLGGVVVVASGDRTIADVEVRQVRDHRPAAGPLAGIEAGLRSVSTALVAVLAVDTADPDPELFRELAQCWDGEAVAVVPEVDGILQPLHACWSRTALPGIAAALQRGERSPTRWLRRSGAQLAGPEIWAVRDRDPGFARSLNRPEDLDPRPGGEGS